MTAPSNPSPDSELLLAGEKLAEVNALLRQSGYDFNEAHPDCYRNFSYIRFFELCTASSDAAHCSADSGEPIAWLDIRTAEFDWQTRLVATNRQYVESNGPENFAPLFTGAARAVTLSKEEIARIINGIMVSHQGYTSPVLVDRLADGLLAVTGGAAQPSAGTVEDWSRIADFLDDIEADENGMCRWAEVANAKAHIRRTMRAVQRSPDAAQPSWQPIETAPKDGTKFDAWLTFKSGKSSSYRKPNVWWCDQRNHWTWDGQWGGRLGPDIELTHWMPTPASPMPSTQGNSL